MAVTIKLPTQLRDATGGQAEVSGEDIRYLDGLETQVDDGAELNVLPAVAGG